jgi:CRISPR-associated protein Cas2
MADKSWHLITYDVRDPKRLRRVAKKLEGYGERMQYSVFRCRLDRVALEKLCWELAEIMKDNDDLLVMPICGSCASGFHFIRPAINRPGRPSLRRSKSCSEPHSGMSRW